MTPEQERALFDAVEGIGRIEAKLDDLAEWRVKHEKDDAEMHAAFSERTGGLEKHQTRLYAIWAAACVIVPAVSWFLVAVGKAGTP